MSAGRNILIAQLTTASARVPIWVCMLWLIAAGGILAAACLLDVGQDRAVMVPWIGRALPETCAMHSRFGIDCPGCGLTRSFIHIADGRVMTAWHLNPVSWLIFVYVVVQIPLAAAHAIGVTSRLLSLLTTINQQALIVLVLALVAQWLFRLFHGDLL